MVGVAVGAGGMAVSVGSGASVVVGVLLAALVAVELVGVVVEGCASLVAAGDEAQPARARVTNTNEIRYLD